jgi:hypothetical protein
MGELGLLLDELTAHRIKLTPPATSWAALDEAFEEPFPMLPLFHRLGRPLKEPEKSLKEFAIRLEVANAKTGRAELGIDQCIFASIGVAPHWTPPVVLCFGPVEAVRNDRCSVPWDSRGVGVANGWTTTHHAERIAHYSLCSVDDEHYLARHLATCFQQWDIFLAGGRPVAKDPSGILAYAMSQPAAQDMTWLTTPEARFSADLNLDAELLAAFVDADYPESLQQGASDWQKTFLVLRRILERKGKPYRALRRAQTGSSFASATAAFVQTWLRGGGLL